MEVHFHEKLGQSIKNGHTTRCPAYLRALPFSGLYKCKIGYEKQSLWFYSLSPLSEHIKAYKITFCFPLPGLELVNGKRNQGRVSFFIFWLPKGKMETKRFPILDFPCQNGNRMAATYTDRKVTCCSLSLSFPLSSCSFFSFLSWTVFVSMWCALHCQ